ncbi:MAG: glycosyl transferase, partial [Spirosoma sp.]|nr:glycosyl transferase [Spirosoma sp.]
IQAGPEYVSLGSGLATFLLFSLSGFQLPHYMNIVFPFFAIITAQFLAGLSSVVLRRWAIGQTVIGVLMVLITIALLLLVRPADLLISLVWVGAATVALFFLFRQTDMRSLMGRMVGVMLIFFVSLNLFLYPTWLSYMAGRTAALALNAQPNRAPGNQTRETLLYMPGTGVGGGSFWSYEFYAKGPTRYVRSSQAMQTQVSNGPKLVFTSAAYADSLRSGGFRVRPLATFPYYHVSMLSTDFLNADTRAKTLESYILAEVLDNKKQDRPLRSE